MADKKRLSRRAFLKGAGLTGLGVALAAAGCQPKTVVVEKEKVITQVVEKEKVVKETIVVEKPVGATPIPPTTLRFAYYSGKETFVQLTVAAFQSRHPDVEVELEPVPGNYNEKSFAMAAAGTLAEVTWTADSRVIPFAEKGVSADMLPMAQADPENLLEDMDPVMRDLGSFKGGFYMVPWANDAVVMYYNKTLFEQAGVPEPPPEGWPVADWIENCKAVTNEDEQIYGTFIRDDWWAVYVAWMEGYGGTFYNEDKSKVLINSPEAAEACQAIADTYIKHHISVPKGADLGGDPFLLGKAATTHLVRNFCKNIHDVQPDWEWDVCLPPRQPVRHVTGAGTHGTSVTPTATREGKAQVAWELAKTLIIPSVQKSLARQYLIVPVLKSLAKDPSWYDLPPPPARRDVFLDVANISITPPNPNDSNCGTVYIGETNRVMTQAWEEMIIGEVPAQEALDKAAKLINDCIASGGA